MKNFFFILVFFLCIGPSGFTQTIKNGGFEDWDSVQYWETNEFYSSNNLSLNKFGVPSYSKSKLDTSNGKYHGVLKTNMIQGETLVGVLSTSPFDPLNGPGGFRYNALINGIDFSYSYSTPGNDSALMIVKYNKGGVFSSSYVYHLGKTSGFSSISKRFAAIDCDTVVVTFTSSNIFDSSQISNESALKLGGLILYDNSFGFRHFEFNSTNENMPAFFKAKYWETEGRFLMKTTDSYAGNGAISLTSKTYIPDPFNQPSGQFEVAKLRNYHIGINGSTSGGAPYKLKKDTLIGYYKYLINNPDTARLTLELLKDNNIIYSSVLKLYLPNDYYPIELPFETGTEPDTLRIRIESSDGQVLSTQSTLILDELQLASSRLNTGIKALIKKETLSFKIFPNPVQYDLKFDFGNLNIQDGYTLEIFDLHANQILRKESNQSELGDMDVQHISKGIYQVIVTLNDGTFLTGRFVKD